MVGVMPSAPQSPEREGTPRAWWLVMILVGIAGLVVVAHGGVALWSANELTQPEGVIALHVRDFARQGTLYYKLEGYPYTVCLYMPIFYGASAALVKAGLHPLLSGRVVSLLALVGVLGLLWQLVRLYTGSRLAAWLGMALAGLTQLLVFWGSTGQVDMLALAFSLAAFHQFARYQVESRESLDWAALWAVAGLFTKQTYLAAPAAIFLMLLWAAPRRAWRFGLLVGGVGGAMVLGVDGLLGGRFLENTVFANMNAFAWYKLQLPLQYLGVVLAPLLLVAALGARASFRTPMVAPYLYLVLALGMFSLTAPKVGADSNYLIESAALLVLCGCCALSALRYFELTAVGSKSWVTLLALPLALYAVQNLRVAVPGLAARVAREQAFVRQVQELRPYLEVSGRVLSVDSNALVQAGRNFEVEPLIHRWLVEAGRIHGKPVQQDLETGGFESILLFEDLAGPKDPDPEIPRFTVAQMEAIRQGYALVKHVPGPYLGGIYVYQRRAESAQRTGGSSLRSSRMALTD
jgi:hypothetical protein